MTTIEKLTDLKALLLEETLNDDKLSRYEKLSIIEDNNLWETAGWIQHPFQNGPYGKAFLEELKANPEENGYVCTIMDEPMFEVEQRGETVSLSWFFEEDHPEDFNTPEEYEEFLNSKTVILTSRGRPVRKMEITQRELLDYLWNWALTNNCCAWKYDW